MKPPATIVPVEPSASEAIVEQKVVQPLLQLLGYDEDDIVPKYSVSFQQGRKSGRPSEADFVVFGGKPHDRNSSIIVVEAKRASENISTARAQAESYAIALKAPFIILTNGVNFEVWRLRPTMENELIISMDICDVSTRFGQLESCIGKEATLAYARKIEREWVFTPLIVFRDYVDKQIEKSNKYQSTSARRLHKPYDSDKGVQTSDLNFLTECKGAVIIGSSGMGKTVVGYRIFRQLLQDHLDTAGEVMPFYINLVDVGHETLLEYALSAIRSAYPALSMHSFESLLRERSVTIICDTFDQAQEHDILAAEFRKLLTRYDKLRLIVLTRRSSAPEIGLPIYELLPLSHQEQHEVAGDMWRVLHRIPEVAKRLCENPLLLSLFVEHWRTHDRLPNDLAQLFQTWLDRILRPQTTQPSEREMLLHAMIALAQAPDQLSISAALIILQSNGLPINYLDVLVHRDAIEVHNRVVSFSHESLRDYLKALSIKELDLASAKQVVEAADLATDSLFPILLMSLFRDPERKAMLWSRLGATSLETINGVVAFNSRDWYTGDLDPSRLQEFLTGVADGIDLMVESFLPQMRSAILRSITWNHSQHVCVAGEADSISYAISFLPRTDRSPRTMVAQLDLKNARHGWQSSGGPIDWMRGCTIGINNVERAVLDLVRKGKLSGGLMWRREVVCGWLRVLKNGSYFEVPNTTDVTAIADSLERHTTRNFSYHGFAGSVSTEDVIEIIEYLRYLKNIGIEHIDERESAPNNEWDIQQMPHDKIVDIVIRIFTDAQHLYKEIVENNFLKISAELRHFNLFPARVNIKFERFLEKWHIKMYWSAASSWDECGVDILPENSPINSDLDKLFKEMERSYLKYGKDNATRFLYWTGWSGVISGAERWRQHRHESTIVRVAIRWLEDDLKRLFKV